MKSRQLLPLLLLVLLIPLLAGCGSAPVLPADKQSQVLSTLVDLDKLDLNGLIAEQTSLDAQIKQAEQTREPSDLWETIKSWFGFHPIKGSPDDIGFWTLKKGYGLKRIALLKNLDRGKFEEALTAYQAPVLRSSAYGSVASMRVAQVAGLLWNQNKDTNPEQAKVYQQYATKALEQFSYARTAPDPHQAPPQDTAWGYVRVRDGLAGWPQPIAERDYREGVGQQTADWPLVPARKQANYWINPYYQGSWQYLLFNFLVGLCAWAGPNAKFILAILLIAVLAKLVTTPFSVAQFRNMRAMQLFQPELKKLQEKYKDDKQAMAKAQMDLMKEHKVNPASSCLPMILQMVILIQVYWGIRHYIWNFQNVHFLYLPSLANPDQIMLHGTSPFPGPILILYAASMYFTQKLISMPAATPEQAQQQRMMSVMMPFLMLMIMQSLPAAFILYWFLQNVLMTGHQWLIMRPHRAADAAAAAAAQAAGGPSAPKDKTQAPAPPEALQRLSQESKPKKKKKRRY